MTERIIRILNELGIALWRLTETREHSAELYFIRKELDIPRIKEEISYRCEVFCDFEEEGKRFRGQSTALLYEGMTDGELRAHLEGARLAAGFVKNPWYELAEPVKSGYVSSRSPLRGRSPEESAMALARAMFSADTADDAFLNSVEIFVTRGEQRILGANGLDVSFGFDKIWGELVAQAITPVDVEQYRSFSYDRLDEEALRAKVTEAIADVRARARAAQPPATGSYELLLSGEHIATLLEYYTSRSAAAMIAADYSKWTVGTQVQTPGDGEALTLSLSSDIPFSEEGIPMPERKLLEEGRLALIHGITRYCRYAGVEPTGNYEKLLCANGSRTLAELRRPGVLEPVSFSDFQMDPFDGHFKGEIRLAHYYRPDGSVVELTGGSVNGCLPELAGSLVFSLERYADMQYEGPMSVLIPGVAVAGA